MTLMTQIKINSLRHLCNAPSVSSVALVNHLRLWLW